MIEDISKDELQERIENAINFLETEYGTYPSGEAWRKSLKKILEGKDKIKKINMEEHIGINLTETVCDKINEIIDKLNNMEEGK